MSYTEIFVLMFCVTVSPLLIMCTVALVLIYMSTFIKRKKIKQSREALELEIQNLNERCKELLSENAILMRENHRLRRFEKNGYQSRNVSSKLN